jgi:hypothetical protein
MWRPLQYFFNQVGVMMGGSYEKTVEAQPKVEKAKGVPPESMGSTNIHQLRIHESKGEIHFHNDNNKLKVAMPVAEFNVMMRQLKRMKPINFVDDVNKTVLTIEPIFDGSSLALKMVIVPATLGDNFKALNDILNKK